MPLSKLLAGIWFILWAISALGWASISATFMGVLALIIGILWVLEALSVFNATIPLGHREV